MTVLPPTLREKRRYLLAQIDPWGVPANGKELYYAIYDAATALWGDIVVAAMQPEVISIEHGHAILRCRRGTEREYAIALSTVTRCGDKRVALRVIATSGTIDSLRDRIKERRGDILNDGQVTPALMADGNESLSPKPAEQECRPSTECGDSVGNTSPDNRDCTFDARVYQIAHGDGHKVDVIEKGFKNTHRLFLTTSDLEEK